MLQPSFNRSPSTLVCFILSLPAKSMMFSLEYLTITLSSWMVSEWMKRVKMTCERELSVFMEVRAIFLSSMPSRMSATACLQELSLHSCSPSTQTPLLFSLIWCTFLSLESYVKKHPYQIKDLLIINLHIRACNCIFLVATPFHLFESLLDQPRKNTARITIHILLQLLDISQD